MCPSSLKAEPLDTVGLIERPEHSLGPTCKDINNKVAKDLMFTRHGSCVSRYTTAHSMGRHIHVMLHSIGRYTIALGPRGL
eukprot:245597-Prymnesium_polylepis.1